MKRIDRDTAKKYIYVTKKDGEKRLMNCRLKVKKYVKGVGRKFKPGDKGLVGVFDVKKDQHRFINLHTLESLKISGVEYTVTE